ncbi:MAG: glucose-6-phosphate dehydrogenase (NADP(+)), partial [Chloroflexi bacterium]|nr:glucose-6-phosphate dehydrogenase (NADP(+)) [Chloroflexota bacterium]
IDHVQITVAEDLGLGGRGAYYERAGIIRDMIQNHMLQLLALVAMEPPSVIAADPVRDEKVKVLHALRPLDTPADVAACTVRGQYVSGFVGGQQVKPYREEEEVATDSETATFAAIKLFIDNWRWADVPFYLRSGKRLAKRVSEIAIHFRQPPLRLFGHLTRDVQESDVLALNIQPHDGISLRFTAKVPGSSMALRQVNMDFLYGEAFGVASPEAYERLLVDAMIGDPTLYTRRDEVEAAWRFITPTIDIWDRDHSPPLAFYEAGTWGPREAHEFLEHEHRRWRRL